jgi:hypothetical protein
MPPFKTDENGNIKVIDPTRGGEIVLYNPQKQDVQPITPASLSPNAPIQVVQPQPTTVPVFPSISLTPSEQAIQNEYTTGRKQLASLISDLAGESAFRAQEGIRQDIVGKQALVKSLQNQFSQLQAERQGIELQLQQALAQQQESARGQGITSGGLAPSLRALQTAANQQLLSNAIKAYSVGAQLAAAQNDYATAVNYVDQAVNAEFGAKKAQVEALQKNLELLKSDPTMTSAERKRALDLELEVKRQNEEISQQQEEKKTIYGLALQAAQNGAPSPVINQIMSAKGLADALAAGTGWLQKETAQIIQEYSYYKRQEEAAGRTPVSFNEYQNIDANRKIAIAKAGVGTTGLTTQQYNALNQVTTRFQADDIINLSVNAGTVSAIADQVIANPDSATNQIKALYILVKNLDPNSAVREGELHLAELTQSYKEKFNNIFERINEGRSISPRAAKQLAIATKELIRAWDDTAKRRQMQYASQAKVLGISDQFDAYVKFSNLRFNEPSKNDVSGPPMLSRQAQEKANAIGFDVRSAMESGYTIDEIETYLNNYKK